ncbi:General alpha-glucoside permease like protein [Verticillium longisporum]|nr:General alpha-glucoside permease like protein [Verticillium longisporum]
MAAAFLTPASTSNSTLIPTGARDADSSDAHYLSVDSAGRSTPILTPSQSSNGQPDTDSNPDFDDDWHPSSATSNPGGYVGPTRRPSSLDRDRDIDRHAGEVIDGEPTINRSIREEGFTEMSTWAGQPHIKGNSEAMRMVLLTFNAIGITFTWGVEMTYCTPYLLNLGLTKSNTSLVWIAGPLSGLIVQPIVGVIADQSTSKWGRRRPFIVMGSIIAALSMIVLGFTQEIVGFFVADEKSARGFTITLAVLAIYAVDFAINAVMSCARSLIVDTLPIEKQQAGAAWSSRMHIGDDAWRHAV